MPTASCADDASDAATLACVPATQIGQNLAFINWTVLTGLALGTYAAVVLLRGGRRATSGYLAFTTACAIGFGVLAWLSDGALPTSLGDSPVVVDPAWDAPRRTALVAFSRLVSAALLLRRVRPGSATACAWAGLAAGVATLVFGALAWGGGAHRQRRAPGPAGGRDGRDRRRLRGDDPRPLVPRDARSSPRRR